MPMGENGRWEYQPGQRRRNLHVRRELHTQDELLPWQADDASILEEEYDAFMASMPEQAPEEAGEGAHLLGWILGGLGGVVLLLALATWLL